ncbi:protein of unknown function [Burkholderia multivorans]
MRCARIWHAMSFLSFSAQPRDFVKYCLEAFALAIDGLSSIPTPRQLVNPLIEASAIRRKTTPRAARNSTIPAPG